MYAYLCLGCIEAIYCVYLICTNTVGTVNNAARTRFLIL